MVLALVGKCPWLENELGASRHCTLSLVERTEGRTAKVDCGSDVKNVQTSSSDARCVRDGKLLRVGENCSEVVGWTVEASRTLIGVDQPEGGSLFRRGQFFSEAFKLDGVAQLDAVEMSEREGELGFLDERDCKIGMELLGVNFHQNTGVEISGHRSPLSSSMTSLVGPAVGRINRFRRFGHGSAIGWSRDGARTAKGRPRLVIRTASPSSIQRATCGKSFRKSATVADFI